ncbi:MAG TPA: phytanoyl-CoA dioxygenase family protein [Chthonomonadaceae bacterium]|nr:phytanoyl-CoA dioxygenase family protein [Chthonomonadaceae bacterium]
MLTQEQKAFFNANGYLVLENVWSQAELAEARRQMRALLRDPDSARPGVQFSYEPPEEAGKYPIDPDNPRRVWMIFDTPLAGDWWYNNIRDPRVVDAMADLLGPNINFHNGKARIKPPGYQTHQIWHQDWPYEHHTSPDLAAALFYLDDTDVGAAATEVIPGSHKQGEWPHDEHNAISEEQVKEFGREPVPVAVRAGSVAIIHVLIVHRASPNTTDRNRSAIINEYKTMETLDRWGNKCAFAELPLRRNGKPI